MKCYSNSFNPRVSSLGRTVSIFNSWSFHILFHHWSNICTVGKANQSHEFRCAQWEEALYISTMLISSNLCSHTKLVYTTYVQQCYHPHHRKIKSSFLTMLRFSASVGFRLLWWMKNLHLSCKTLQVPLRSPCNLHSSFTINVRLDSLRCSKNLSDNNVFKL